MKTGLILLCLFTVSCKFMQMNDSPLSDEGNTVTIFEIKTNGDVSFGDSRAQSEFRDTTSNDRGLFDVVVGIAVSIFSSAHESPEPKESPKGEAVTINGGCLTTESCDKPILAKTRSAHREGRFFRKEYKYRDLNQAKSEMTTELEQTRTRFAKAGIKMSENAYKLQELLNQSVENHNKKIRTVTASLEDLEAVAAQFKDSDFKTIPESSHGRTIRDISQSIEIASSYVAGLPEAQKITRMQLLAFAKEAVAIADLEYYEGSSSIGDFAIELAWESLDLSLGIVPETAWVKDIVESVTGYNIILGRDLTTLERSFAVAGVLSLGLATEPLYFAKGAKSLLKIGKRLGNTIKPGFLRAVKEAVVVGEEAAKIGFTGKGLHIYAKLEKGLKTLSPELKIVRIKEGVDPEKIAVIGLSMGDSERGLVGVNDVAKHFKNMVLKQLFSNRQVMHLMIT